MKDNKTKGIIILLVILLIIALVAGIWAYSKYTSTITGQGGATVASWSFKVNGQTATITNVSLTDTTLNSKVTDGKIAPGTDGSFGITVDGSGSDVEIAYSIQVSNFLNMPTNLKFYSDSTFTTPLTVTGTGDTRVFEATGTIALADIETTVSQTIYWRWEYETGAEDDIATNDAQDTIDAGSTPTFTVRVVGTQVDPRS